MNRKGEILGSEVGCPEEVLLLDHPGHLVVFSAIDITIPEAEKPDG